ncbi:MAG: murein biosynthesis integral membrane protein MurJ [bacterium]|nr:murein biosynthesis integral membrane protein MurJ [bacterium]
MKLDKNFLKDTLISSRGILVGTTFASYVLGLLRDRLFAHTFGAGQELDAYQAAFLLPDFLLNFLIAGGLAAAFVPLFLEAKSKDPKQAILFARTITTISALLMLGVGALLFIFAPYLATLVAPGFGAENHILLVRLVRVLAFSPTIFAASNALGGILVAENRFLTYGLAPVFYNAGIIVGTFFLAPHFGILGVAYGTIGGALLHLAVRLLELKTLRFPIRPAFHMKLPQFIPFLRLSLPKMFGHPVEMATFWGFTALASTLPSGSIAILNFARNFQSVPISLIGISFATVSFSLLAKAHAEKDRDRFNAELNRTMRHIVMLSVLAALGMFFFRNLIISLLIGGGSFDEHAVRETALLLGAFTLSIPFEAVSHLQARAFYAAKNTLLPVLAGAFNLIISVFCAWMLIGTFGLLALPLGYAIGTLAKVIVLGILLPRQLKNI